MRYKTLLFIILLTVAVSFGAYSPPRAEPLLSEEAQFSGAAGTPGTGSQAVWLYLDSVQNARQLGGYPVKDNRVVKQNAILRSGELASLTEADRKTLADEYGLNHIIDLRDEIEARDNPDPVMEGVRYHHLIVWPMDVRARLIQESTTALGFNAELYVKKYYAAFALEPAAIAAYREMFEILLENEAGSVLIHCVYGKDRTGVAAALLLSALGAEWGVVEREYLLSGIAYAGSVDISSLRYYKSVIEANYGSMEKYLKDEMNLGEDDLTVLMEKYTAPS